MCRGKLHLLSDGEASGDKVPLAIRLTATGKDNGTLCTEWVLCNDPQLTAVGCVDIYTRVKAWTR